MSTIDTKVIRDRVDLVQLVGQDVPLHPASRATGEFHGPCPWCGGKDRFLVKRDACTCRQCVGTGKGQWMDAVAYVRRNQNLGFAEACEWLARWAGATDLVPHRRASKATKPEANTGEQPAPDWQEPVRQIIQECAQALWSDAGPRAREWLHQRGLQDQTLQEWQIGYNKTHKESSGRKLHGLWVWHGITIPWSDGHRIWAVNVRRSVGDKYKMVKGSRRKDALFGVNHLAYRKDLVIVEGEFDAMLLWQEAGDLADVLTLGGSDGRLSPRWLPALLSAERVWIATDNDEAGHKAAEYWMKLVGNRGRRVFPGAKDVTEAWQAGHNLREWVETFLATE